MDGVDDLESIESVSNHSEVAPRTDLNVVAQNMQSEKSPEKKQSSNSDDLSQEDKTTKAGSTETSDHNEVRAFQQRHFLRNLILMTFVQLCCLFNFNLLNYLTNRFEQVYLTGVMSLSSEVASIFFTAMLGIDFFRSSIRPTPSPT